jgi:putative peptidoglycan lipid II flippase
VNASGLRRTTVAFLALYALSRLIAFGRESTIAYLFGATRETDSYVAATALPELVAGVLLSGVLGYAIIPEFLRRRSEDDLSGAANLLQAALSQVLLLTGALVVVAVVLAGPVVSAVGPGLDAHQHHEAVRMLRVASPAMVLYGLTGVAGAVLNARTSFLPVPLSFVVGNTVGIAALIAFSTYGILAAALGYVATAAAFAAFQWTLVRRRTDVQIGRPTLRGPEVAGLVRAGLIAILITSAPFLRGFVERILASTASVGDLAALGFATRLILVVGSLVAVSVGTVVFPTLAEQAIALRRSDFVHTLRRAVATVVAVSLPASLVLVVLPSQVVSVLFERGEFGSGDTAVTAAIVRAFAFGLIPICVSEILLRALFALGVRRAALAAVMAALALNLALDVWLLHAVGVEGLGIGASVALWVNMALLGTLVARAVRSPGLVEHAT